MKILRIIGEIGLDLENGPARQAYVLTKNLSGRGVESEILTFNASGLSCMKGVELKVFKPRPSRGHYRISEAMLRSALRSSADVIHAHGYRNYQSDVGALVNVLRGKPLVVTTHGSVSGYSAGGWPARSRAENWIYDAVTRRFSLHQADAIVATSANESSSLLSFGLPGQKLRVISPGMDLPPRDFTRKLSRPGRITILSVSRLTKIRNLEMLIRGFALARESIPSLFLIIAGGTKPSKFTKDEYEYGIRLRLLADELSIGDFVSLPGWVYGEDLWSLYTSADIFAWTSLYESFGQALIEASYFGLPIVSTPVGVATELIGANEGGILVPHSAANSLASAIVQLARDEKARRAMGMHNQRVALYYSSERMTDAYVHLYQSLIN